jgi:hypothetical protein
MDEYDLHLDLDDPAVRKRLMDRCRRYRITVDEFKEMWAEQGARCAICRCALMLRTVRIDHYHDPDRVGPEHIRNQIRGLLCNGCNGAVGYFDRYELGHQFEWIEAEAVEAHMRIEEFRIGRPLYLRAVQSYLTGEEIDQPEANEYLLTVGRQIPWRHPAWANPGFNIERLGVLEFHTPSLY